MAKLKEILEKEKVRQDVAQCREIRLFPEGTFYRAYEWSAWLCFRYISEFKPTRRGVKDSDETFVFVGFPIASLPKFVPEGTQPEVLEDRTVILRLPPETAVGLVPEEPFLTEFQNWKSCVPLTETKPKEKETPVPSPFGFDPKSTKDIL